jgi:ankyrin repeat protein
VKTRNSLAMTPLFCAFDRGYLEIVQFLLESAADFTAVTRSKEFSPLYAAIGRGYVEIVQLLLGKGVDVNSETDCGETPLL